MNAIAQVSSDVAVTGHTDSLESVVQIAYENARENDTSQLGII